MKKEENSSKGKGVYSIAPCDQERGGEAPGMTLRTRTSLFQLVVNDRRKSGGLVATHS